MRSLVNKLCWFVRFHCVCVMNVHGRQSEPDHWGGGGGGEGDTQDFFSGTPTFIFSTSKFWVNFSRHRVGVPIVHHQPLWQAPKKTGPHSAGELTCAKKRVLISINNLTTPKSWGGGGGGHLILCSSPLENLWGGGMSPHPPPPPPIDAHVNVLLFPTRFHVLHG